MSDDETPPAKKTRRVKVRTVHPDPSPLFDGDHYRLMDLDENIAGQWDDDQWHSSPPGI